MATKTIFCANCQDTTVHEFRVDRSPTGEEELISKCLCGRELKFPANASADELRGHFDRHKAANVGHVKAIERPEGEEHPVLKALAGL